MAAALDEDAAVEDENDIGVLHRAHAVGDEKHGLALKFLGEIAANLILGNGIQRAGCLVEDEQAGPLQHGTGYGNPLALAAREGAPLLADLRVVTLREAHDEVVRSSDPRGAHDIVRRAVGVADGDV